MCFGARVLDIDRLMMILLFRCVLSLMGRREGTSVIKVNGRHLYALPLPQKQNHAPRIDLRGLCALQRTEKGSVDVCPIRPLRVCLMETRSSNSGSDWAKRETHCGAAVMG